MKIDFANLQLQYQTYKEKIDANLQAILNKSNYILGEEVNILEQELQNFTGAKYAITCSSGTDALLLALMAMDIQPGDEIITTPFTFISTAETITFMKAKPVFIDIESDTFNINANLIEAAITNKTKVIMPVSLFGQPADMYVINSIAKKYNLKVIIDGAQSFGSTYDDKTDSNLGDISTTSFFPAKPLGCYGDGGAVFTNNNDYAEKIKMMRVHGQNKRYHHKYIGMGGRLDTIQAAILLAKLPHYKKELEARQKVAQNYTALLSDSLQTPVIKPKRSSAWAQYTVRVNNRDDIQAKLKNSGIPTAVYYPISLHLQECFKNLNYKKGDFPISEKASNEAMSLPMNSFLTNKEIDYICNYLKSDIIKKNG
jgi:UDP-2-acetamido-2-deoxy-ribo-hexuluronate aminotransferase